MSPSSLTSITSSHEIQHRAKRIKSMKDMDNLTQLTSPGKQNQEPKADIWEFTGSSDPKPGPLKLGRTGKENATKEKNTYGKLRRSKTVAHTQSSQSVTGSHEQAISQDDNIMSTEKDSSGQASAELDKSTASKEKKTHRKLKRSKTFTNSRSSQSEVPKHDQSSSKDDSHGISRKRRASHDPSIDIAIPAPKGKKPKHNLNGTNSSGESSRELMDVIRGTFEAGADHLSNSEFTRIQVPRTARQQDTKPANSVDLSFVEQSGIITSPRLKVPRAQGAQVATEKSNSSISIVPATLTDSQKMTYEYCSVTSTNQEHRFLDDDIVSAPKRTEQSTAVSNGTPQPDPLQSAEGPMNRLSSSPPIVSMNARRTRANSLSRVESSLAAPQDLVSSAASVKSAVVPKMKRSKTMTSGRTPQSSIDELAYTRSQQLEKSVVSKATSKEQRKKAKKQPEERVNADDLFGSDEVGLPRELYQPRPSRQRSKSMGITPAPETSADLAVALPPPKRRKSMRAAREMPASAIEMPDSAIRGAPTQHNITLVDTPEDDHRTSVEPTAALSKNKKGQPITSVADTTDFQEDEVTLVNTDSMTGTKTSDMPGASSVSEAPLAPVPPKRRGRPPNVPTPAIKEIAKGNIETTVPRGEALESVETPADLAPKAAPPAKRRGRPPKITQKVVETPDEVETPSEDTLVGIDPIGARNARKEDHYDAHSKVQADGPSWSKPADFLLPKSTPPQATESIPLVTPTKNVQKGPDHSPLPSSKVPLRVGLSKRTRIAPLLKMIKK